VQKKNNLIFFKNSLSRDLRVPGNGNYIEEYVDNYVSPHGCKYPNHEFPEI
jgi:hypothetical protein